jgi:flagellar hook protein FlgE
LKVDATGAPSTAAPGATVSSFSINAQGDLQVTLSDNTTFTRGQVLLQNFANPNALVSAGNNLYVSNANAGPLSQMAAPGNSGTGAVQSGALEASNVDLTGEMTSLITAQNAYEANSKVVTSSDEALQSVIDLIR